MIKPGYTESFDFQATDLAYLAEKKLALIRLYFKHDMCIICWRIIQAKGTTIHKAVTGVRSHVWL